MPSRNRFKRADIAPTCKAQCQIKTSFRCGIEIRMAIGRIIGPSATAN